MPTENAAMSQYRRDDDPVPYPTDDELRDAEQAGYSAASAGEVRWAPEGRYWTYRHPALIRAWRAGWQACITDA